MISKSAAGQQQVGTTEHFRSWFGLCALARQRHSRHSLRENPVLTGASKGIYPKEETVIMRTQAVLLVLLLFAATVSATAQTIPGRPANDSNSDQQPASTQTMQLPLSLQQFS